MFKPYTKGPRRDDILLTLADGPLTTQEIAVALSVVDSTAMHQPLYALEREGLVVRKGHKMMARPGAKRAGKRIIWGLADPTPEADCK